MESRESLSYLNDESFTNEDVNAKLTQFYNTLLFETPSGQRFTQDTPILSNVWLYYARHPCKPLDLILTLKHNESTGKAAAQIRRNLKKLRTQGESAWGWTEQRDKIPARLTYLPGQIAVRLYYDELIRIVLPMTPWYEAIRDKMCKLGNLYKGKPIGLFPDEKTQALHHLLTDALMGMREGIGGAVEETEEAQISDKHAIQLNKLPVDLIWLVRIAGMIAYCANNHEELGYSGKYDTDINIPNTEDPVTRSFNLDYMFRQFDDNGATIRAYSEISNPQQPSKNNHTDEIIQTREEARKARAVVVSSFLSIFQSLCEDTDSFPLWRITRNRQAELAVNDSSLTVKADAARRLFEVSCEKIVWAVIDSGIDGSHPAFADTAKADIGQSVTAPEIPNRIKKTFDFTNLRDLLDPEQSMENNPLIAKLVSRRINTKQHNAASEEYAAVKESVEDEVELLHTRILKGHDIDWETLEELITDKHAKMPKNDHGTHVAGILGADWVNEDDLDNTVILPPSQRPRELQGICPDIKLIDCRVFRDDGETDEFEILAAVQFLRWLNSRAGSTVVHGINMSISLVHEVRRYACGQTPICIECNEASSLGMVIVAAAGNRGFEQEDLNITGRSKGYKAISITDPGNAENVITVGATHRKRPHEYGVSYFSSRGPTGDGRMKPDIVAPGEKIAGPTPNHGIENKDGTSMAAPHVSGAAAMLMSRHTEFIGQPNRIKKILCDTATDLNRYDTFQGKGLLDILRAMQSV